MSKTWHYADEDEYERLMNSGGPRPVKGQDYILSRLGDVLVPDPRPHYDQHAVYGDVKRLATDADRARIASIAERSHRVLADFNEGDVLTTSVSFNLSELVALAGGFVRSTDLDARIYDKLNRAKDRLIERLGAESGATPA